MMFVRTCVGNDTRTYSTYVDLDRGFETVTKQKAGRRNCSRSILDRRVPFIPRNADMNTKKNCNMQTAIGHCKERKKSVGVVLFQRLFSTKHRVYINADKKDTKEVKPVVSVSKKLHPSTLPNDIKAFKNKVNVCEANSRLTADASEAADGSMLPEYPNLSNAQPFSDASEFAENMASHSFSTIFENKDALKAAIQFSASNFMEEVPNFLCSVEHYQNICRTNEPSESAYKAFLDVLDSFIRVGCPQEINICEKMRKGVLNFEVGHEMFCILFSEKEDRVRIFEDIYGEMEALFFSNYQTRSHANSCSNYSAAFLS